MRAQVRAGRQEGEIAATADNILDGTVNTTDPASIHIRSSALLFKDHRQWLRQMLDHSYGTPVPIVSPLSYELEKDVSVSRIGGHRAKREFLVLDMFTVCVWYG